MPKSSAKPAVAEFRRAGGSASSHAHAAAHATPFIRRWYGRVAIVGLVTVGMTLAYAPISQFYLTWIALVPLLFLIRSLRSQWASFLWSWVAGFIVFVANTWWMFPVTVPGTLGLSAWNALYWGFAGWAIKGCGLLDWADAQPRTESPWRDGLQGLASIAFIGAIWASLEWLRGTLVHGGMPWLYIGHAQTPILSLCQIADITGVYGISFFVVMVNVLITFWLIQRLATRRVVVPAAFVGGIFVLLLVYGWFRISEATTTTHSGPRVLVVQCNYPQSNTGAKGASLNDFAEFHLQTTTKALEKDRADLVAWSETVMPPLNPEARSAVQGTDLGDLISDVFKAIQDLARQFNTSIITGSRYEARWVVRDNALESQDSRNSTYLFEPSGLLSPSRYDKIHLVSFGEFIPFEKSIPWLHAFFVFFVPQDFRHVLTPGMEDHLTIFTVPMGDDAEDGSWRFVTPICFEDVDAALVSQMFRGHEAKRADFIVNVTNDGWFYRPQQAQHLQIARFRSIENRVPTARAVNLGISTFIDSCGRVDRANYLPPMTEGTATTTIRLDSRYTVYTRFGNLFAILCTVAGVGAILLALVRYGTSRQWGRKQASTDIKKA